MPGVWFFSLDANNAPAVLGARVAFHLPYFRARMSLERRERTLYFASRRANCRTAPAEFEAVWTVGGALGEARPGSLEFFLIERYCLYSARGGRLYRARIFHRPRRRCISRACPTTARRCSSLAGSLPSPGGEPLLHQQGEPLKVSVWPKTRIR